MDLIGKSPEDPIAQWVECPRSEQRVQGSNSSQVPTFSPFLLHAYEFTLSMLLNLKWLSLLLKSFKFNLIRNFFSALHLLNLWKVLILLVAFHWKRHSTSTRKHCISCVFGCIYSQTAIMVPLETITTAYPAITYFFLAKPKLFCTTFLFSRSYLFQPYHWYKFITGNVYNMDVITSFFCIKL